MPANSSLLSLCAVLDEFDRPMLGDVDDVDLAELEALVTDGRVVVVDAPGGRYRLVDAAEVLAELKRSAPDVYLSRQTQALAVFRRRLGDGGSRQRADDERRCFVHLQQLFEILSERRDWVTFTDHVEQVGLLPITSDHHRHLLDFYRGTIDVRAQRFLAGTERLSGLLQQSALSRALRGQVYKELGNAAWLQTQYHQALERYRQAHRLAVEVNDLRTQSLTLVNMSFVYNELRNHAQALALTRQSLAVARQMGDRYREAYALYEIGNNCVELGRWQEAADHFREAIGHFEALRSPANLVNLYWGQGVLAQMLGDERESERWLMQAVELADRPEQPDRPALRDSLLSLGFLYRTQARWDEAMLVLERAVEVGSGLGTHRLAMIHYHRGAVYEQRGQLEEALAALAEAIDTIETLRGDTEGEELKLGLLVTSQHIYETMVLLCLRLERPALAFDYVERARSQALLDRLIHAAPTLFERIEQPVTTLAEVQAQLPPDAMVVEYFTTGVLPRGEHLLDWLPADNERLRAHLTVPPSTLIFVVTRDGLRVQRAAGDPNALRPPPGDHGPGRWLLSGPRPALLYRRLIEPIGDRFWSSRQVYLIPHGPLHAVPFMALHDQAGQPVLRRDGPTITLAPSATILLRCCLQRQPRRAGAQLAIGYDEREQTIVWHAEVEARAVARLSGGQVWYGRWTKSRHLLAIGPRLRRLHIAGHAVFDPSEPLASYVRLGADDHLSARTIIDELSLQADLVTLGACATGVSHVVPGDELFGLPRAFICAGAAAVVVTLWEVSDLVTLLIMERFYQRIDSHGTAMALRDAQVAVRELTVGEVLAAIERLRASDPVYQPPAAEIAILASAEPSSRPYADARYWAPFIVIGRD